VLRACSRGSTTNRFSSSVKVRFFFQPVQFHTETDDLTRHNREQGKSSTINRVTSTGSYETSLGISFFVRVRKEVETSRIDSTNGLLQSVMPGKIVGIRYDGLKLRTEFAVIVNADVLGRWEGH
jgi:hypothetical protein